MSKNANQSSDSRGRFLTLVTFAGAEPACRTKSFCLSLVASPHYQPPGRANGTTNNGGSLQLTGTVHAAAAEEATARQQKC
jgi:hypothetical protein